MSTKKTGRARAQSSSDGAEPDSAGGDEASSARTDGIEQLSYEQCRDELVGVVQTLEQGGLSLDASLALWERGEELAQRCEEYLAGAHQRIEDKIAAHQDDNDRGSTDAY